MTIPSLNPSGIIASVALEQNRNPSAPQSCTPSAPAIACSVNPALGSLADPCIPTASTVSLNVEQPVQKSIVKFLSEIWRGDRIYQIGTLDRQTKKFKNLHVNSVRAALDLAIELSGAGTETYLACAEYLTPNSRIASNAAGAFAFWFDIDCGEDKATSGRGYATEADARIALEQFCCNAGLPQPTYIVYSGGGLHAYWVLDAFVDRVTWQTYAGKFKSLTKALNFLADDCRTADIASVLRIPGTFNYKYVPPRPVTLAYASDTFISRALMFAAINDAYQRLCDAELPPVPINLAPISCDGGEARRITLAGIQALISLIEPDIEHPEWVKVLMAIFHATSGSTDGLEIANAWSAKGEKYAGFSDVKAKWVSFKSGRARPITLATVCKMVAQNGHDWQSVIAEAEDPFEICETTVEHRRRLPKGARL